MNPHLSLSTSTTLHHGNAETRYVSNILRRLYKLGRHTLITSFVCLLGFSTLAPAQAVPTATRSGYLQAGGGVSLGRPDYTDVTDQGVSAWVDFDFTSHIGVEAIYHNTSLKTPKDVGEDTYLVGPRYVFHKGRYNPYVKILGGIGIIKFQPDNAPHTSYTYTAFAGGGGLDIRATNHISIRAIDIEAQMWPSFKPNSLSPFVATVGVSYTFR